LLRILLEIVLPFLAPFLLFFAYRLLVTKGSGLVERTPWFVLVVSGLVLACASLVSLAFTGGAEPGGRYEPARIEDGKIVPGAVRPPDEGGG
jgi:hypothetical protein